MWPEIGHAVWIVPICLCVCVCACYLRQLLTQLRAGGPWHQCGWREARYWRSVQRVLNPGLLEGSLSFSHSFLSLSPFLSSLTKCLQSFLCNSVSVWQVVWDVCCKWQILSMRRGMLTIQKNVALNLHFCHPVYFLGQKKVWRRLTDVSR